MTPEAIHECGWFENLWFWYPQYQILVPESIWATEFTPTHEVSDTPAWLETPRVSVEVSLPESGQLSRQDWDCLLLAREAPGILITRDRPIKERAEQLGIETMWAADFLLETFERCGIATDDYRANLETYISNAYLPAT